MRTAIYGAGSLGTILGAFINKAGMPVELINRNKAHVEALKTKGAQVVGTMQFTQTVTAYTPEEMSGKYDIIFLMTKQQNNKEVVTMLKEYLEEDGVLVTFQNGLPEMQIAEILGTSQTMYARYERGANEMPLHHLITICKFYNVSADFLLNTTPDKHKPTKRIKKFESCV